MVTRFDQIGGTDTPVPASAFATASSSSVKSKTEGSASGRERQRQGGKLEQHGVHGRLFRVLTQPARESAEGRGDAGHVAPQHLHQIEPVVEGVARRRRKAEQEGQALDAWVRRALP